MRICMDGPCRPPISLIIRPDYCPAGIKCKYARYQHWYLDHMAYIHMIQYHMMIIELWRIVGLTVSGGCWRLRHPREVRGSTYFVSVRLKLELLYSCNVQGWYYAVGVIAVETVVWWYMHHAIDNGMSPVCTEYLYQYVPCLCLCLPCSQVMEILIKCHYANSTVMTQHVRGQRETGVENG